MAYKAQMDESVYFASFKDMLQAAIISYHQLPTQGGGEKVLVLVLAEWLGQQGLLFGLITHINGIAPNHTVAGQVYYAELFKTEEAPDRW